MNSQEYWRKRVLYAKQKELNSAADYEDAMRSRLKDLENVFAKEAQEWVAKYAKENDQTLKQAAQTLGNIDPDKFDMTLGEFEAKARAGGFDKELNSAYYKQQIARLQQLHKQFEAVAAKYASSEEQKMAIALAKQYKDTYLLDKYNKHLVMGGMDIDLSHFNEEELKQIVYQPWQGSDFSDRIWHNYTEVMPDVLTDSILKTVVLGYSYQDIEKELRDKFQAVTNKNIHRLVITEMGHAAEQATSQFYKDSNIDQYQYMATLESHTCEVCAHLDGRIFYVKNEKDGVNYPLIHPYCRCTTVPYIKDLPDIQSRWYRDPVTGKGKWTTGNMNYSEWAKASGVKLFNKKKFIEAKPKKVLSYLPKISGALNESMPNGRERMDNHAKLYYDELKNSNRTILVKKIKNNTKVSRATIDTALTHILDSEYPLKSSNNKIEIQRFYPDYDMAESLQRVIMDKPLEHDIIMLQHEALEAHYMDDLGMDYEEAHDKANEKYNYQKALLKYRKTRDKS